MSEPFKMMAEVNLVHVPYRGAGPALTDLLGGQVQVQFATMSSSIEYIRARKLHALAVTTATRSDALPDIPTMGEFVPGDEASIWYGIGAPKGTPADVIAKVNRDVGRILQSAEMKERSATLGFRMIGGPPERLAEMLKSETAKWAEVAKSAGLVTP